jgi:hypothetical protein
MNNLSESQEQALDNLLCEFTDQVLSEENDAKTLETLQPAELVQLQKNILRVKAATSLARPSAATTARVRARLLKDWKKTWQTDSLFTRLFGGLGGLFAKPSMRLALAGSLAMLFIFGIATTLIPGTGTLTGAAIVLQAWAPVFILTGILVILILIWLDRRN